MQLFAHSIPEVYLSLPVHSTPEKTGDEKVLDLEDRMSLSIRLRKLRIDPLSLPFSLSADYRHT